MADVDEIIDYIKTLRRGFDKELFQSKIDELGYLVETIGLDYEDFHTLFKVWLNLAIPIAKWVTLGTCIVPQEKVREKTVNYAIQWILGNYDSPTSNVAKIGFLLDWLTVAMETESIDMNSLEIGYEVFYCLFTYEALAPYVMKLLYTLTKPADVARKRVLGLIDLAKKRDGKKNMVKQIHALLGLLKSYKPQCVPEAVLSVSVDTTFRKVNETLTSRFRNSQVKRNSSDVTSESGYLFWTNPLNMKSRSKKADPLIPNLEFVNIGSQLYEDCTMKSHLDFSDSVSLLQYRRYHDMRRPARLRALLCNPAGLTLLVAASDEDLAFLSYDLQHMLSHCFLENSPYSYVEKQDFLSRLATFQATLLRGLPAVTNFLAQYLPFWNEKDFFAEILKLTEWVNVENVEPVEVILATLAKVYLRAQPLEQLAILRSVTTMYNNLITASTQKQHYFLNRQDNFAEILELVAKHTSDMIYKGLQVSPGSASGVQGAVRASVRCVRGEVRARRVWRGAGVAARALCLALPLLCPSAASLDALADLLLLYKENISTVERMSEGRDQQCQQQKKILKHFSADFISCFYELGVRRNGVVFSKLDPQTIDKLLESIPNAFCKLSLRNHLAFAPYVSLPVARIGDNRICFDIISEEFPNLRQFLTQAMPALLEVKEGRMVEIKRTAVESADAFGARALC